MSKKYPGKSNLVSGELATLQALMRATPAKLSSALINRLIAFLSGEIPEYSPEDVVHNQSDVQKFCDAARKSPRLRGALMNFANSAAEKDPNSIVSERAQYVIQRLGS